MAPSPSSRRSNVIPVSIIKTPPQAAKINPEGEFRPREIYRLEGGGLEGGLDPGPQGLLGLPEEQKGSLLLVQGIKKEAGGKIRGQEDVAPGSQVVTDLDF